MYQLCLEDIIAIHVLVLAETGGGSGIRDMGRLEAVIASQTQEVFGKILYPSIVEKAAAVIRGMIADHPFVDGNKRTVMLAGLTLLKQNNMNISLKPKELEDFAVKVAVEHLSIENIASWLEKHTLKST